MEEDPDLSGFPVLRLDQLDRVSSDVLHLASTEVRDLLCAEDGGGALAGYMRRQLREAEALLLQRAAAKRIQSLLCGDIPQLPDAIDLEVSSQSFRPMNSVTASRPPARPDANIEYPIAGEQRDKEAIHATKVISKEDEVRYLSFSVPGGAAEVRRSLSASLAADRSFGVAYVVSGVDRKRRHLPKKTEPPSREELLVKDKLVRRKAAMTRLVERKEQRDAARERRLQLAARHEEEERRKVRLVAASSSTGVDDLHANDSVMSDDDSIGSEALSDTDNFAPTADDIQVLIEIEQREVVAEVMSVVGPLLVEDFEETNESGFGLQLDPAACADNGTLLVEESTCHEIKSVVASGAVSRELVVDVVEVSLVDDLSLSPSPRGPPLQAIAQQQANSQAALSTIRALRSQREADRNVIAVTMTTMPLEGKNVSIEQAESTVETQVVYDAPLDDSIDAETMPVQSLTQPGLMMDDEDSAQTSVHSCSIATRELKDMKQSSAPHQQIEEPLRQLHRPLNGLARPPLPPTRSRMELDDGTQNKFQHGYQTGSQHGPLQRFEGAIKQAVNSLPTVMRLSEVYPTFWSLFPHCVDSRGLCNVRNLVEALQIQGRLYAEWLEVMEDYATVFSAEPEVSATDRDRNALVYGGHPRALHFRIKTGRSEVCNIVSDAFARNLKHWIELPQGLGLASWNLLWTWSKPRVAPAQLTVWQRFNHFPDSKQLTRKDLLKRNLQRYTDMRGRAAEAFEVMPLTFVLPLEYNAFVNAFMAGADEREHNDTQNLWIMKPVGLSRGRGISLVRDLTQLTYSQASVLQKYVERPLCLRGYKFDLRLYVLVTSFRPLEAFIYKDGFARVSTQKYSLDPGDTANKFIHLTNSSIQKQNSAGASDDNPANALDGGSKIALHGVNGLWARLEGGVMDSVEVWRRICLLVIKSLVAVNDQMTSSPGAFEVFGYDVLIDADLRPWLIEVNASPSMARENPLDARVKDAMIRDTIRLLDVAPFDREALMKVIQRRLADLSKSRYCMSSRTDPELEADLRAMLGDFVPRRYGEPPKILGDYQRLCPGTDLWDNVLKLRSKLIRPELS